MTLRVWQQLIELLGYSKDISCPSLAELCTCMMLLTMIIDHPISTGRLDTINQARKRSTSVIQIIFTYLVYQHQPSGPRCPDNRGCTVWGFAEWIQIFKLGMTLFVVTVSIITVSHQQISSVSLTQSPVKSACCPCIQHIYNATVIHHAINFNV